MATVLDPHSANSEVVGVICEHDIIPIESDGLHATDVTTYRHGNHFPHCHGNGSHPTDPVPINHRQHPCSSGIKLYGVPDPIIDVSW
jgi:hypothetical protein